MAILPADRVSNFSEPIFAQITRRARKLGALDLSTGYPDQSGPPEPLDAVYEAMKAGHNQYPLAEGEMVLREAISRHTARFYGSSPDPTGEITVTNGAAQAFHAIADGLINPGDEVIIFEPYYAYYPPNIEMAGGVCRYVPLRPPDWTFDPDELAAAFNEKTRSIWINSPHNPTGKVFSRSEFETIAELCDRWDVFALSDEVYEHLVFDDHRHERLCDIETMRHRTITVGSLSKTFNSTGWRVGWTIAAPALTKAIRLAHQFVVDGTATPIQHGAAAALELPDPYFEDLRRSFAGKRNKLQQALAAADLIAEPPAAGYFLMADIARLGYEDDVEFCLRLVEEVGLAAIPPSAFFSEPNKAIGQKYARFAYCKTDALLEEAAARLKKAGSKIMMSHGASH
jgi:N-succinyldiaminopimelate aminotransferase